MMSSCTTTLLKEVKKNFFLQVPFRCFKEVLIEYILSNPKEVLTHTIFHKLNEKYPLKRSYKIAFLKSIIDKLEEKGEEVEERLYHCYISSLHEEVNETHFVHFLIDDEQFITILQNTNIISGGTTGLNIWQAGKVLAEYCQNNKNLFANKSILELGCGVGLTGLAVTFACNPTHYCFSDTHEKVLNYLVNNIKLNLSENVQTPCIPSEENDLLCYQSAYKNTEITVVNLNWENTASFKFCESFRPDIILAADVIYDSKLFRPFCHTLKEFIKFNRDVQILISCTIRNTSTLEEFFDILHEFHMSENLVETFTTWDSSFKNDCYVKIISISYAD